MANALVKQNIMLVGEAWGEEEDLLKQHFVGPTGQELRRLCTWAGFDYKECYVTNVLHLRPQDNDMKNVCVTKSELPKDYHLSSLGSGRWLDPQYLPEITRLWQEIETVKPNIIIALGATAFWALTGETGINKNRGVIRETMAGHKMIATYHPAQLFRVQENRPILLADLIKGYENSHTPHLEFTERELWIEPELADLYLFEREHLAKSNLWSIDIETTAGQITCIGFAPDAKYALVVPFWDRRQENYSYWSLADEVTVRFWLKKLLESPVPKVMQNGAYDMQYLYWEKIYVQNCCHDTMFMAHVTQPELPKSLEFLGAVHTNSPNWKHLSHRRADDESAKKED